MSSSFSRFQSSWPEQDSPISSLDPSSYLVLHLSIPVLAHASHLVSCCSSPLVLCSPPPLLLPAATITPPVPEGGWAMERSMVFATKKSWACAHLCEVEQPGVTCRPLVLSPMVVGREGLRWGGHSWKLVGWRGIGCTGSLHHCGWLEEKVLGGDLSGYSWILVGWRGIGWTGSLHHCCYL